MKVNVEKYNEKDGTTKTIQVDTDKTPLTTTDMERVVQCANCHRSLLFGDTFTSRTIQTGLGLGYPVCGDCYQVEAKDWMEQQK